MVDVVVTV
ncbi:hypothetical protein D046_8467, partial [Vibrio parahaemolyticus V-223/04]